MIDDKSHLPRGFGRKYLPVPLTRFDGRLQPSCGYRLQTRSERAAKPQKSNRTNRTHVEDVEDPDKVLVPTGNIVLVVFSAGKPRDRIPFTALDDPLFDLGNSFAIETSVSVSLNVDSAGLTHVVRSLIASMTALLSPSSHFPFNLRKRTWHMLPQDCPRST